MTATPIYSVGANVITSPTGAERFVCDNGGAEIAVMSLNTIAEFTEGAANPLGPEAVYNTNAATAAATLTGANIVGASTEVVLGMTGTFSGAAAITLPTVAALLVAQPNFQTGASYILRIINIAAGFTLTVTTNTGWTVNGTATIASQSFRDFIVTVTSVANATATIQNIGSGSP
jgi:hypothetical protein